MGRDRTTRQVQCVRWLASILALTAGLVAGRAHAQSAEDINTQRFLPRATTGGYLQTEGTHVRYPIDPFSMGLWLSYGHNPLIAVDSGEVTQYLISSQVAFDLTASYAFAEFFEMGVHLPIAYLSGDDVSEGALGDIRLLPKFRLLDDERDAIGLGLIAEVRLPSHTSDFYGGARLPGFVPRLLLDHQFGLTGFRLGLDLGVLLQKRTDFANVSAGSELQAGLGLGYRFDGGRSPVELMVDLRSALGLTELDAEEAALEALGALGIDVAPDWTINLGGGVGLLQGFGVPTFRALAGVRWEPSPNDPDHDGVASSEEQKAAADEADEDPDSGEEDPTQGEEDAAQVADSVDDEARRQAIEDGYDACPTLPEDYDGIEDDDGCPEGDRDKDGVLDYLDRCDGEEETINGFEDDDGCPDEGPAQIIVEEGRITIRETIRFELNSDRIDPESDPILNQIALTLRKHQEIEQVEIGGHTDNTGSHDHNVQLSHNRARAVRRHLISLGIKPRRLSAQGYGPDRPIADNATDEGRAENRRVEFVIKQ